jgi:methionyl-tRNA formyltransferase
MNIAFFSSSEFTLPIVQSIYTSQGESFCSILQLQYTNLDVDSKLTLPSNFGQLIESLKSDYCTPIKLQIVVTQPDRHNRNKIIVNPIAAFARQNCIVNWTPENLNNELNTQLDAIDLILTASYGQFVGSTALSKPKLGSLNWHPSLLPHYRGATPLQSSLLAGDSQVGLSWIDMVKKMDEGKVYWQLPKKVEDVDNFNTLINYFGNFGANTWAIAVASKLLHLGFEQDNSRATNCSKFDKADRLIDSKNSTAKQVFNHYKALIVFPGTSLVDEYFGGEIKILECQLVENESLFGQKYCNWLVVKNFKKQRVFLECDNNSLLEVFKIGFSSGKTVNLSGFQFVI